MDDTLLLDAIERYKKGEMTPQEKTFLEELRKNNPDIDQLAVEHTFFLQQLENTGDLKAFRHSLNEVENKLVNEGVIAKKQLKGKAKVDLPVELFTQNNCCCCNYSGYCFHIYCRNVYSI